MIFHAMFVWRDVFAVIKIGLRIRLTYIHVTEIPITEMIVKEIYVCKCFK